MRLNLIGSAVILDTVPAGRLRIPTHAAGNCLGRFGKRPGDFWNPLHCHAAGRAGDAHGGNDLPFPIKDRAGNGADAGLKFLIIKGISLLANELQLLA